jgi:GT2 family glycosyltransferase
VPPAATIQLCTYNRAHLLERVLHACFEQDTAGAEYEVVLVNDGSTDDTENVITVAKGRAPCAFTAITQANAGLARGRNVGIAAAQGERIIFIDDDVLPMPNFVAEHLRASARDRDVVVRGAVIEVESFDRLPPPIWSFRNYSGNWFWTSNVSVSRRKLEEVGCFDETFSEYGWEDIELGLRLREAGVRGVFNKRAVAFHYKPKAPERFDPDALVKQKRAQARTARILARKHPGWRVALATGDNPVQRTLYRAARRLGILRGKHALAADAYFDELLRAD